MKRAYVIMIMIWMSSAAVAAERFFGEFQIANWVAHTKPTELGVGGFTTTLSPINAQVVVKVDEAQSLTWEWIGITFEPNQLLGFPRLSLDLATPSVEYRDKISDLNPVFPNVWGAPATSLPLERLMISGEYASFSHSRGIDHPFHATQINTFDALEIDVRGKPAPATIMVKPELDYANYPRSLRAYTTTTFRTMTAFRGELQYSQLLWLPDGREDKKLLLLEPQLELYGILISSQGRVTSSLRFTPTGDANSDGQVDFGDFAILANNFAKPSAALPFPGRRWASGDFNDDDEVSFADFVGLANNFGLGNNAADGGNAASVPEPLAAPATCLLMLLLLRRRLET